MEPRSVGSKNADGSEAREVEPSHLDRMSLTTPASEEQDMAGNVQQKPRDPRDIEADKLEQRLIAMTADDSSSKSSKASFETAREQTSPMKPSQKALGKRKEEKTPKKPDPVARPPPRSILKSTTITQTSSRPATSHRDSMTNSSTAPTSQVSSPSSSNRDVRGPAIASTRPPTRRVTTGPTASAASSRRSSFLLSPPAPNQTIGPARGHRRSNTTWPPPAPTSVTNPKQALQSLQTFSNLRDDLLAGMPAEEREKLSSSLPTLPHPTTDPSSSSSPNENASLPAPTSYSNHVPAANIDWTLPSTRRREYEKINKARRGIRGLLRRATPRFLLKNGRVGFHDAEDGKGSDAGGTVRRYRMDEGGDDDDDSVVVAGVGEEEEEGEGAKGAWWKFGKKMKKGGKGKGKKNKDESPAEPGN